MHLSVAGKNVPFLPRAAWLQRAGALEENLTAWPRLYIEFAIPGSVSSGIKKTASKNALALRSEKRKA